MSPGRYVGYGIFAIALLQTCLVSGRSSSNGHEVQEGTKECDHTSSMEIFKGASASILVPVDTEKQILVSHYDFQKHNETQLLFGTLNYLHRLGNETEVSLVNHGFTLQKVKKADEGLYQVKEYNEGRCLAQVNVTVLDPPPSPGTTNLPNIEVSATPTPFPPEQNNTVMYVLVGLALFILVALISCFIQKCIKCRKERMSKYKFHASSQSSSEEESQP